MNRITRTLLLTVALVSTMVSAVENNESSDEAIMRRELEWAESTMEGYRRKNGIIPLRSSIAATHVHTDKWKNDSMDIVQGFSSSSGNLRGGSNGFADFV